MLELNRRPSLNIWNNLFGRIRTVAMPKRQSENWYKNSKWCPTKNSVLYSLLKFCERTADYSPLTLFHFSADFDSCCFPHGLTNFWKLEMTLFNNLRKSGVNNLWFVLLSLTKILYKLFPILFNSPSFHELPYKIL